MASKIRKFLDVIEIHFLQDEDVGALYEIEGLNWLITHYPEFCKIGKKGKGKEGREKIKKLIMDGYKMALEWSHITHEDNDGKFLSKFRNVLVLYDLHFHAIEEVLRHILLIYKTNSSVNERLMTQVKIHLAEIEAWLGKHGILLALKRFEEAKQQKIIYENSVSEFIKFSSLKRFNDLFINEEEEFKKNLLVALKL